MPKIQTLAEMEAEDSMVFANPVISDEEFAAIRKASAEKAAKEMLTCPIDESSDDDTDDDCEDDNSEEGDE